MLNTYSLRSIVRDTELESTESLRSHRGWLIAFGLLLIVLGVGAAYWSVATTYASMAVLGGFLVVGAFVHAVQGIASRKWSIFFIQVLVAILYLIAGVMTLQQPMATAMALTLMIAGFFFAVGLVRVFTALAVRMPSWGWWAFNGVVTTLLGFMVMKQWPVSGLWVIGLFVGIDLLTSGVSLLALASTVQRLEIAANRVTKMASAAT